MSNFLDTSTIYALQDVIDHLEEGGRVDFNEEYTLKLDQYTKELDKSHKVIMSGRTVFVPKSKSDYRDGDTTIDINGWMLKTIITENLQ